MHVYDAVHCMYGYTLGVHRLGVYLSAKQTNLNCDPCQVRRINIKSGLLSEQKKKNHYMKPHTAWLPRNPKYHSFLTLMFANTCLFQRCNMSTRVPIAYKTIY